MNRVRLWARVGMEFYVEESDLHKVDAAIKAGKHHIADSILQKALLNTGTMSGEGYIPDNEDTTGGFDILAGYTFQDFDV